MGKNYEGATLFMLTKQGNPHGILIRRSGFSDEILDKSGVWALSMYLDRTGQKLANATLTDSKIKPRGKNAIGTMEVDSVTTAQVQPQPQSPVQPQQPPPAATQAVPPTPTQPKISLESRLIAARHAICRTIIHKLYGATVDVEKYKVYDGKPSSERLSGVDITAFDNTKADSLVFNGADRLYEVLDETYFTLEEDDKWELHNVKHDIRFKAFAAPKATSGAAKSVLHIHPVRKK